MGLKQSKTPARAEQMGCIDDLMCQNIDSRRSVPGQTPVLVCPNAKCLQGMCACGDGCTRDPYTGMCCSRIEEKDMGNGTKTTFCIEEPFKPSGTTTKEAFTGTGLSFGPY